LCPALQLVSLFCTDLQRSLIIGHIIKTPQSRCMYHWDGPLGVEDETRLRGSLSKALREEGYAVDTACDGEEGLFKAENYGYDAILLDIVLPVFDGWELLERLRKARQTPVLMLTARDAGSDRVRGLDLGADDYLAKPFDLPELFARLRALIRRSAGHAQARIDLGEVSIDLRLRMATVSGEPVTLTAREYSIVEYLALHHETDDTLSNLMDVHIFNVRRKLGRALITTRRGEGYCIV
jgi:two-component system OmpR family response regulator